jgi:hypothetical protein
MNRLLHACARGARVKGLDGEYYTTESAVGLDNIHPDDEHLQYGPISTALREIGLTGTCDDVDIPYVKPALLWEDGYCESTEEQRRVFCLILAECLADEGM